MFDAGMRAAITAALYNALSLLATPAVWTQAKPPHTSRSIEVGIKTAGPKDEAVINAYGVGAKIITMKATDFVHPPEQFDQIKIGEEVYVLADVHSANVGDVIQTYKGYTRGKRV